MILLQPVLLVIAGLAAAPSPQTDDQAAYTWAAACRDCHKQVYEAWEKTKHERALNRLNAAEQDRECVECHVTGAKKRLTVNDKVVNGGVQCESCHGPGRAHAADPSAKGAIRRVPEESVCTVCHSDRGPHFKFFNYRALSPLSHPVGR